MSTTSPAKPPVPPPSTTPTPSPSPSPSPIPTTNTAYPTISPTLLHKAAWGAVIVSPILILMPPRKLDMYTFGLLITTCIGANHIRVERTGYGFIDGYAKYMKEMSAKAAPLPPAAVEMQKRLRAEREREMRTGQWDSNSGTFSGSGQGGDEGEEKEGEKRGVFERLWMGNEREDWIDKRKKEEAEALAAGKSYAEIMGGFIWEAWSGGRKEEEEGKAREARELIARRWEEERRKKKEREGVEKGEKGEK